MSDPKQRSKNICSIRSRSLVPPSWIRVVFVLFCFSLELAAVPEPAALRIPKAEAWTGERLRLFVDLQASGTFAGAASFAIPEIPGSVLLPIGNPVVSSKQIDGEEVFVQTHEFALFSQREGSLTIPSFTVRFEAREGFTGPTEEIDATIPAAEVEIWRPPGTESLGFLVSTTSLDIDETWDPEPAPAKAGAVFKRRIVQRAKETSGMALTPAPTAAPEGVRVYPPEVAVNDTTARGALAGERSETVTYLFERPGSYRLPEIRYSWWDPEREKLSSKSLPAVMFEIAPAPEPPVRRSPWFWLWVASSLVALPAMLVWKRNRIRIWTKKGIAWLRPPERMAARRLLAACRKSDAPAAYKAWSEWRGRRQVTTWTPEFLAALSALEADVFSDHRQSSWDGATFAKAFRQLRRIRGKGDRRYETGVLPPLNPLPAAKARA